MTISQPFREAVHNGSDPMPFFRSPRKFPDLVTAMIEMESDGSLHVEFVGDPPQPKGDRGYSDIDSLVEDVLDTVRDTYQPQLGAASMGFQFAWYPWKEPKKAPALEGLKDSYLMFELRQLPDGYVAGLAQDPTFAVSVTRLHDLPDLLEAKTKERWPVLQNISIPGMIHWNRNLSAAGFIDIAVAQPDPSP